MAKRLILIIILSSCSTYKDKFGFDSVSEEAKKRIYQDLEWREESHQEINNQISSILNKELNSSDVIKLALINNFELQAKYKELGLSQADLVQASYLDNPSSSISKRFPGKASEFDFSINFISALLLPMKKQMAEYEFEATKLEMVDAVLAHAFKAKELFHKYQLLQSELSLLQQKLRVEEAAMSTSKEYRKAGNIQELEFKEYEQKFHETRLELLHKKSETVAVKEQLNIEMGLSGAQTNWDSVPGLYKINSTEDFSENLEDVGISNRPDILSLNKRILAKAKQLGIVNITSYLPQLTITSHFEREPEGKKSTGPSIDFPIPIFNWGSAQRAAARNILEQANDQMKSLEVKIRAEVRSAQAQLAVNKAKVQYFQDFLIPVMEKKLTQAQLQYNAMNIGVFDLLKVKSEQTQVKIEYVNTVYEFWISRLELEKALGKELPHEFEVLEIEKRINNNHHHMHHHGN